MCWSGEASTVMATIGFIGATFEYRKATKKDVVTGKSGLEVDNYLNKHILRSFTLFYFSLMELLQAWNYIYLDAPGPMNSLGALLGFLHISFQPIATLWFMLSFLPGARRRYWFIKGTFLAFIACILFLLKGILNPSLPGCMAIPCTQGTSLYNSLFGNGIVGCSADMTYRSYPGEWHIAWQWVVNSCGMIFQSGYTFVAFFFPLILGCYRIVIYTFILGPFLAYFLTGNSDEWAAVWCLLSIGFLIVVKVPMVEKFMTVKHESWKDTFKWLRKKERVKSVAKTSTDTRSI